MWIKKLVILLFCIAPASAACAQQTITLSQALERARLRGPQIIAAQDRIAEARGRLAGASVLFQENPVLDGAVGPRYLTDGHTTDYDVALRQAIELGGRRSARIAAAQAGIERETANSRDVARLLLRDVSVAFMTALAAKERLSLADASSKIADELFQSMRRRYDAGDVPILDVNITRNSLARARAEVQSAKASYASALGDLRIFLAMNADEQVEVVGELHDRQRFELPGLLAKAGDRPELRSLEAETAEAQADIRLGEGMRWPTVTPAFIFKRDQGDLVLQGGVGFTLPVFNRGQELQAVGQARAQRAGKQLASTRQAVSVEVRTAYDVYNLQVAAVQELERDALPSLAENETLARRSFEEGEIGLAELLLVRRESYELRTIYTQRLLEAAVAGIELESRAGVLQ